MTLRDRLGLASVAVKPPSNQYERKTFGKVPVKDSEDLQRIEALPRRPRPTDDQQSQTAAQMTALLRRDNPKCRCKELNAKCITHLLPVQGWYLLEAMAGGALGHVSAGAGKTLIGFLLPMVVPNVKRAVLLVQPDLLSQALHDFEVASQHFRLPNLAGAKAGPFYADRPVLDLLAYSKLSAKSCTAWLSDRKPDLVIADEAQNLSNVEGVRGDRFLRYFMDAPYPVRLCAHSGSLTVDGLDDYSHLSALALLEGSPLPIDPDTVVEWASALDPFREGQRPPAPPGALLRLCAPGEHARSGFRRRLVDTLGGITTLDASIPAKLVIRKRPTPPLPEKVAEALAQIRGGERPDGEELVEDVERKVAARQAAYGFYYYWRFPRGEPDDLILRWYAARKAWGRALRARLEARSEGMDSPLLLTEAADRYDAGYVGPLPVWHCPVRAAWRGVQPLVQPVPAFQWIDDFMAADAARWGRENVGIIYYQHTAFGRRLAEIGGFPIYEGGDEASAAIRAEDGTRTVVASLKAHGTGKNLQMFHRGLLANSPSNNGQLEQVLARLHRTGQEADAVTFDFYCHTPEVEDGWEKALSEAAYKLETTGSRERVLFADRVGW